MCNRKNSLKILKAFAELRHTAKFVRKKPESNYGCVSWPILTPVADDLDMCYVKIRSHQIRAAPQHDAPPPL